MAASTADKLRKGFFGSATALSGAIGNTDTTIPLNSTLGFPTDTGLDLTVDRIDANGNKTPSKQETIKVTVSGNNGINAVRGVEGTAQAHSAGAIVEITYTAATHNDQIDAFLKDHVNGANSGAHNALHDVNGNNWIDQSAVTNAVNRLQVANAATGGDVTLSAVGSDTNINLDLLVKGSGKLLMGAGLSNAVTSYTNSGTAGGTFFYVNIGGIKFLWGLTAVQATVNGTNAQVMVNFPASFFTTIQYCGPTIQNVSVTGAQYVSATSMNTSLVGLIFNSNAVATATGALLVIGT